mmetsp:Transcript_15581/g.24246  ORF Transcript_15581/g.24246 Transcript_15581/m.24246 type:complete len:1269 (+) Transcript_15581:1003-4809(+)
MEKRVVQEALLQRRQRLAQRLPHRGVVVLVERVQVVPQGAVEHDGVLGDDAQRPPQVAQAQPRAVHAVQEDGAGRGLRQPEERHHERGLPAARAPRHAHLLAAAEAEVHFTEHQVQPWAVPHGKVAEFEGPRRRPVRRRAVVLVHLLRLVLEVAVLLDALGRGDAALGFAAHAHGPVQPARDLLRVGQHQARRARVHRDPAGGARGRQQQGRAQHDGPSQQLQPQLQPPVADVHEVEALVALVQPALVLAHEGRLQVEGPHGGHALQRLAELREDGAAADRLQPLQVPRDRPVPLLHQVVHAHDGHDGQREPGQHHADGGHGAHQLQQHDHELRQVPGQREVDVVHVLGEPVEHAPDGGRVEEGGRRADDPVGQHGVQMPRAGHALQCKGQPAHEGEAHGGRGQPKVHQHVEVLVAVHLRLVLHVPPRPEAQPPLVAVRARLREDGHRKQEHGQRPAPRSVHQVGLEHLQLHAALALALGHHQCPILGILAGRLPNYGASRGRPCRRPGRRPALRGLARRRRRCGAFLLILLLLLALEGLHQHGELALVGDQLLVAALLRYLALLEHHNLVRLGQEVQLVGAEHARLPPQQAANQLVEQVPPDVGVHRRERVVEHVEVGVGVGGPGEGHALLLAAAEVDALLADLGGVARGQHGQVRAQRAGRQHLVVPLPVERPAHGDVPAQRGVHDPRALRHVGHAPPQGHAALHPGHLAQQQRGQGALAAAHLADHPEQLPGRHLQLRHLQDEVLLLLLAPLALLGAAAAAGAPLLLLGRRLLLGLLRLLLLLPIRRRRPLGRGVRLGAARLLLLLAPLLLLLLGLGGPADPAGCQQLGVHCPLEPRALHLDAAPLTARRARLLLPVVVLRQQLAQLHEALHAPEADGAGDDGGDGHGEHEQREADHVQQRHRREDHVRPERPTGGEVQQQREQDHHEGRAHEQRDGGGVDHGELADLLQLQVAQRRHALLEGGLPGVVLHNLDALEDLVEQLDALVGAHHLPARHAHALEGQLALHGDHQHQEQHAAQRRHAHQLAEHGDAHGEKHGRDPHVVQRERGHGQPLGVVGHQRHHLAGAHGLAGGVAQVEGLAVHHRVQGRARVHAHAVQLHEHVHREHTVEHTADGEQQPSIHEPPVQLLGVVLHPHQEGADQLRGHQQHPVLQQVEQAREDQLPAEEPEHCLCQRPLPLGLLHLQLPLAVKLVGQPGGPAVVADGPEVLLQQRLPGGQPHQRPHPQVQQPRERPRARPARARGRRLARRLRISCLPSLSERKCSH